jgi:dihydroorotate dehydrogenase (fumarate)
VLKYILTGADVVMTTSALLRHGPQYIDTLLGDLRSWLSAREIRSLEQVRGRLSHQKLETEATSERASYLEILQGYGR